MRSNLFLVRVAEPGPGCPGGCGVSFCADIPTRLDTFLCNLIWVFLLHGGIALHELCRSLPIPDILGFCDKRQIKNWIKAEWMSNETC